MLFKDRMEIFKSHLPPYGADRKSFLEINLICQLRLFGMQSPEFLRDETFLSKNNDMVKNIYLFKT